MIRCFTGSIVDVYSDKTVETTIIVPITDIGFIQDTSIRHLAVGDPSIWANVLTFCSGKHNGTILRHIDQANNTQLVFIGCIGTSKGICELKYDLYIQLLDSIISGLSRTRDETPTVYLIEPNIVGDTVFNNTIEDIEEISTKYGVGLNYVLPSSIL